jgi:hypothetical protein
MSLSSALASGMNRKVRLVTANPPAGSTCLRIMHGHKTSGCLFSRPMGTLEDEPEARAQQRSSMFLAAVLRAGTEQAEVRVRNMSPHGAMVETHLTPPPGTRVDLLRGRLVGPGTVIWSSANRCGLRFNSEVSVQDWLAPPSKVQQQRVDEWLRS